MFNTVVASPVIALVEVIPVTVVAGRFATFVAANAKYMNSVVPTSSPTKAKKWFLISKALMCFLDT